MSRFSNRFSKIAIDQIQRACSAQAGELAADRLLAEQDAKVSREMREAAERSPNRRMNQYLTIREYFAGQALTGILANGNNWTVDINSHVKAAYKYADEMLEQGKKDTNV